ncbi:diguanylate cyclase [Actinosynnema sp. NPDC020468]|uniref:diguanylate cyclase domain-containing protein n=1 Tax=Actinosynnema sp. NPDC020468 TaxID=3154488 RepID=UPI0033E95EF7
MTKPSRSPRAPGAAPEARPARAELAERWTTALTRSAQPKARAKIRDQLVRHVGALLTALTDPKPRAREANAVGEWLVSARFTGRACLRRTLEVLGAGLPALVPESADRVPVLLGALAAGYTEAMRREVESLREQVRDGESRFRSVFEAATVGVALFDADGRLVETNPALREAFGGEFTAEDAEQLAAEWRWMRDAGRVAARVERQFTNHAGDPLWTNVALSLVCDQDGAVRHHVAVVEDVTDQRVLRDWLRHQALHDVLTGLPNRQSFLPRLEEALGRPGSITLCYLDVDSVAIVNDGLGYESGDELLKVVAQRLLAVVADEAAVVARIGGDEFVVLIEDSPSTPGISALADAIDTALSEPVYLAAGHGVGVSAGMGFVRTASHGLDAMGLLRQAHSTLRRAEHSGKGQWGIYDAGEDERDRSRLSLIATMPGALENGDIAIDYRPVERDGEVVAVAARLRWHDPEFGPVSHRECLDFADELGLSRHLCEWLLDEACSFAAVEELPVVVRLSAEQSRDPDLTAPVSAALRESGLAPGNLWLSLDSRGLAEPGVEDNLTVLADMGVRRLLHDFDFALAELAAVQRHGIHAVEPNPLPDTSLPAEALAVLLPLLHAAGALVLGPTGDLVTN